MEVVNGNPTFIHTISNANPTLVYPSTTSSLGLASSISEEGGTDFGGDSGGSGGTATVRHSGQVFAPSVWGLELVVYNAPFPNQDTRKNTG